MSKPFARGTMARPIRPSPISPKVAPVTSAPRNCSGPQPCHCSRANKPIAFGNATRGSHQQRPGHISRRFGQHAWCVRDRNLPPCGGGNVDVVEADGKVCHDLQVRIRCQNLVVDRIGQQAQQSVDRLDTSDDFVLSPDNDPRCSWSAPTARAASPCSPEAARGSNRSLVFQAYRISMAGGVMNVVARSIRFDTD